jgi:hypothetical protein
LNISHPLIYGDLLISARSLRNLSSKFALRNLRRNSARFIRKRKNRKRLPKMLRHTDKKLVRLMNFWLVRKLDRVVGNGDPVEGKQKSVHLFLNLFMLYDT